MLSQEQQKAYDGILNASSRILTLGGVAGSGKSFLVAEISKQIPVKIITPTWKAALVLHERGFPDACTIHEMFLAPRKKNGELVFIKDEEKAFSSKMNNELLIVDEASMVNKFQYDTIVENWGGKVLFVGDHGQLPPIGGNFNVMESPDFLLTEIHRQAQDNPIIMLATAIRESKSLGALPQRMGTIDSGYAIGKSAYDWAFPLRSQIIVGMNSTRCLVNNKKKQGGKLPIAGERIILLDNQPWNRLFNGMIVTLKEDAKDGIDALVKIDDGDSERVVKLNSTNVLRSKAMSADDCAKENGVNRKSLGVSFDYAYAITCHKAQGSSFPMVTINNESRGDKRWLYTAVTRAEASVILDRFA
jgi:exodeoxyribonuclease-5